MKKFIKFIFILCIIVVLLWNGAKKLFPLSYYEEALTASQKYNTDVFLIEAIIKAESNFDATAVSAKDAKGLMQVTDSTAKWCAKKIGLNEFDLFLPADNIEIGTYYFSYLMHMYDGDIYLASAAYNAGYGNVDKWLVSNEGKGQTEKLHIPYKETRHYVRKIELYSRIYSLLYGEKSVFSFQE